MSEDPTTLSRRSALAAALLIASRYAPARPAFAAEAAVPGRWERLAPLPDALGVAGAFAGVAGTPAGPDQPGTLLVAGGANFPDKKPSEGGRKVWTDAVYALDRPGGAWRVAGRLPRPLGYGVSVTYRDSVICVGGSDADRHHADVFKLSFADGKLAVPPLPPLPQPVANACGAVVADEVLYVAGGIASPDASRTLRTFYYLNLTRPDRWREADPLPTCGRMLAVAAVTPGGWFWLAGGADLAPAAAAPRVAAAKPAVSQVERRYLRDVYRYHPDHGWERMTADLPRAAVAAPSPAPADAGGFDVLGGDDGTQVGVASDRHRGFARSTLRFDLTTKTWRDVGGELPAGHVTTPCVRWADRWVVSSGEVRPGVRSPEVWARRDR